MSRPSKTRGSQEPPFVYVGGDPSLDLVNTVDWLADGTDNERLTSYERLTRWAQGAGVSSPEEARRLRRRAASRPQQAAAAVARACSLRALLRRLFHEVAGGAPSGSACSDFDPWLAAALARLGVAPGSQTGGLTDELSPALRWRWRGADEHLDSVLWPVAWSAAQLLTSDETHRLRVCAGPDCGWVYVDRSRNRLRRWCQMKTCGTAAKTRRRRRS